MNATLPCPWALDRLLALFLAAEHWRPARVDPNYP
jgi:hypothetical protein